MSREGQSKTKRDKKSAKTAKKVVPFRPKLPLAKQKKILKGIVKGKTYREIAKDAKCSKDTVTGYVARFIKDTRHYDEVKKTKQAMIGMLPMAVDRIGSEMAKVDSLAAVALAKWLIERVEAIPTPQEMAATSDTLAAQAEKGIKQEENANVITLVKKIMGNVVRRDEAMGLKMPEFEPPDEEDPYLDRIPTALVTVRTKE